MSNDRIITKVEIYKTATIDMDSDSIIISSGGNLLIEDCNIKNINKILINENSKLTIKGSNIFGGYNENGDNDGTTCDFFLIENYGILIIENSKIIPTYDPILFYGQNAIGNYGKCTIRNSTIKGGKGGTQDGIRLSFDESKNLLQDFSQSILFDHLSDINTSNISMIDDIRSKTSKSIKIINRLKNSNNITKNFIKRNVTNILYKKLSDRLKKKLSNKIIETTKEASERIGKKIAKQYISKLKNVGTVLKVAFIVGESILDVYLNDNSTFVDTTGNINNTMDIIFNVIDYLYFIVSPTTVLLSLSIKELIKIFKASNKHKNYIIESQIYDKAFNSSDDGYSGGSGGSAIISFEMSEMYIENSKIYGGNGGTGGNGSNGSNGVNYDIIPWQKTMGELINNKNSYDPQTLYGDLNGQNGFFKYLQCAFQQVWLSDVSLDKKTLTNIIESWYGPAAPNVGLDNSINYLTGGERFFSDKNLYRLNVSGWDNNLFNYYKHFKLNQDIQFGCPHGGDGGNGGNGGNGSITIINFSQNLKIINSDIHYGQGGKNGNGGIKGLGTPFRQVDVVTAADGFITTYTLKSILMTYIEMGIDGNDGIDGNIGNDGIKFLQINGNSYIDRCILNLNDFILDYDINDYIKLLSNNFDMYGQLKKYFGKDILIDKNYQLSRDSSKHVDKHKIDAIFSYDNGDNYLMFLDEVYWTINKNSNHPHSRPAPITNFGGLEGPFDGGAIYYGRIYILKGKYYYRLSSDNKQVEPGYPRSISHGFGVPDNIDSIMKWNGKSYVFKNDKYWRLNSEDEYHDPQYPQNINLWGVNGPYDSTTNIDGNVYIFKNNLYYKLDYKTATKVIRGYPLTIEHNWFNKHFHENSYRTDDIFNTKNNYWKINTYDYNDDGTIKTGQTKNYIELTCKNVFYYKSFDIKSNSRRKIHSFSVYIYNNNQYILVKSFENIKWTNNILTFYVKGIFISSKIRFTIDKLYDTNLNDNCYLNNIDIYGIKETEISYNFYGHLSKNINISKLIPYTTNLIIKNENFSIVTLNSSYDNIEIINSVKKIDSKSIYIVKNFVTDQSDLNLTYIYMDSFESVLNEYKTDISSRQILLNGCNIKSVIIKNQKNIVFNGCNIIKINIIDSDIKFINCEIDYLESNNCILQLENTRLLKNFINSSTVRVVNMPKLTLNNTNSVIYTNHLKEIMITQLSNFEILSKVYGSSPFPIDSPNSNSNGSFIYTSSNLSVATINGNIINITGIGNTTITATQSKTDVYESAIITTSFTVYDSYAGMNILNIPGLISYYSYDSYNNGIWSDRIGSKHISNLSLVKSGKYITGTTSNIFLFGHLPITYTLVYIAKYNGPNRKRIFTDNTQSPRFRNWLSGFWDGKNGLAYHEGWITSTVQNPSLNVNNPILSFDTNNTFRANGLNLTRNNINFTNNVLLSINGESNEKSDFAIGMIAIFNRLLTSSEIETIEGSLKIDFSLTF
jgi:hypothetical protein